MMSETVQCSTSVLWDPAQEWIQAFDKLLQYPGRGRIGCSAAACQVRKTSTWKENKSTQKKDDTQDNMSADEANFIHQFPMAGLVTVQSLRGLEMQLMTVWTGLRSKDWRKRRRSLHLVREMVSCGAGQLEQFVDILVNWREGVKSCLMDVRTQVVRDCCITVAYLAQEAGYKIVQVIIHLFPSILLLLQHKSKFIISSGVASIRFILHHTFYPGFLPIICKGVFSKYKNVRRVSQEFLSHILHIWPLHILYGQKETLQDALITGLVDDDASTRMKARNAFWAFSEHFFVEADILLSHVLSLKSVSHRFNITKDSLPARRAQTRKEYAEMNRSRARKIGAKSNGLQTSNSQSISNTESTMTWSTISIKDVDTWSVDDSSTLKRILGTPDSLDSGIAQWYYTDDDTVEESYESDIADDDTGHASSVLSSPEHDIFKLNHVGKLAKLSAPLAHQIILSLLNDVGEKDISESMAAARCLVRVMEMVNKKQVEKHLKEIVPALRQAYDHPQPRVRRCAVTCLASLSGVVGYTVLCSYMGGIWGYKRRLLRLYIERMKEGGLGEYRNM